MSVFEEVEIDIAERWGAMRHGFEEQITSAEEGLDYNEQEAAVEEGFEEHITAEASTCSPGSMLID